MFKQIFVNLPVKNLDATKEFWTRCGFSFNAQFTDENAASLILGENLYAMLLKPEFFSTFTSKQIADTNTTVEVINALSVESREAVDELMTKVLAAGGTSHKSQDYGWMYSRDFFDLDGHHWEVVYMDLSKVPANPADSQPVTQV